MEKKAYSIIKLQQRLITIKINSYIGVYYPMLHLMDYLNTIICLKRYRFEAIHPTLLQLRTVSGMTHTCLWIIRPLYQIGQNWSGIKVSSMCERVSIPEGTLGRHSLLEAPLSRCLNLLLEYKYIYKNINRCLKYFPQGVMIHYPSISQIQKIKIHFLQH